MNTENTPSAILIFLISLLTTVSGFAYGQSYQSAGPAYFEYATVIDSTPIYETRYTQHPQESCWYENQTRHHPVRQSHNRSNTGTILGGIIGAAVGNELGNAKRNKQVGAVAGALLGASIGRDISANHPHQQTSVRTSHHRVKRCETRYNERSEQVITGYNVVYRYKGDSYHTHTPYEPGAKIKLRIQFAPVI